jgi:large repetitive protein
VEAAGAAAGYDTVNAALNAYTLSTNVERVNFTGTGNFIGAGNAADNRFLGGTGSDRFITSDGADIYQGGTGTDTADYRTATAGAVVDFAASNFAGAATGDTFSSIEKFLGSSAGADRMVGTGIGRHNFAGYGGNDTLTGSGNIDVLQGGDGNDSLNGGAGKDTLQGDAGNDTMTGGADRDIFLLYGASTGQDRATDFQDGLDLLKVHSTVADAFSDFSVAGNGTANVVLSIIDSPGNSIALAGAAAMTVTEADFLFY